MDQEFFQWLASEDGLGLHITLLSMLILGGFGFPIPEDVPLILGGVAASQGVVSFQAIFLTCYAGVLLADQAIYLFGYLFGQRLVNAGTKSTFFPSITEERIDTIREGLRRRRFLYILLGRHFFPVRTATFLVAGAVSIPYLEFLIADAIAALISVSLVMWLGYWLGGQLTPEMISHLIHESNYYLAGAIAIGVLGYMITRLFRKKRRAGLSTVAVHSALAIPVAAEPVPKEENHS